MTGFDDFASQAKRMRDELVASATAEADQWLAETLAMLARLSQGAHRVQSPPVPPMGKQHSLADVSLANLVRQAIAAMPKSRFSTLDVRQALASVYPLETGTQRANVANTLRRMVGRNEIVLIKAGRGSRPSIYSKVEKTDPATGRQ